MTDPMITTIYGPKFTAKSSIALTWPTPIAYYDLELGGPRAWKWKQLVDAGKALRPRRVSIPVKSLTKRWAKLEGHIQAWIDLQELLEKDYEDDAIQTIVFDTGTKIRQMAIDSFLEFRQNQAGDRDKKTLDVLEYAEPNRRTEETMTGPKRAGKNLVVVYHDTDEYLPKLDEDGKVVKDAAGNIIREQTGKRIPDGYKQAGDDSDWILWTSMEVRKYTNAKGVEMRGPVPTAEVYKSPYGLDFFGKKWDWATYEMVMEGPRALGRV